MAEFRWSFEAPLQRAKGESAKSAAALWDYAQMGPGRSLAKLVALYQSPPESTPEPHAREEPPTVVLRTLKSWSGRFAWQERVARWEHMQHEAEAGEWDLRREKFREKAYAVAERALERVQDMLAHPLTQETIVEEYEDGREKVVIIEAANWNMTGAARLLAESNKAARLALGETTENTEQHHTGTVGLQHDPFVHLEDAELNDRIQQLLERLGAPGPGEISAPDFSAGPPPAAEGDGPAAGG